MNSEPQLDLHSRAIRLLSRIEAMKIVAGGAPLAIDPCGDGCAGTRWPTASEIRHYIERGSILKRRTSGEFFLCRTEEENVFILLTGGDLRD